MKVYILFVIIETWSESGLFLKADSPASLTKRRIFLVQGAENEARIGKIAIILALTSDEEEEKTLKDKYEKTGYRCAVTGTGGEVQNLAKKINNAVIGACFNNNIIEKTPVEIHSVIHATLEAKQGLFMEAPSGASFVGKIAIIRKDNWLAVAIYGRSAMHFLTNHERIGLGIMHL